jgi:hypothetical protein
MATTKINKKTISSVLILACLWQNSGIVYFISTLHWGNKTIIIQCQSEASKIDVQTLIKAEQYCKFMYLCLFYWFLDSAFVNTYFY